jgi:hypothetical protein
VSETFETKSFSVLGKSESGENRRSNSASHEVWNSLKARHLGYDPGRSSNLRLHASTERRASCGQDETIVGLRLASDQPIAVVDERESFKKSVPDSNGNNAYVGLAFSDELGDFIRHAVLDRKEDPGVLPVKACNRSPQKRRGDGMAGSDS